MKREINKACPAVVEFIDTSEIGDVKKWLQKQAGIYGLKWLLAHADDGVIWGRIDNGELITSDTVAPEVSPPLRTETLQQGRLFATHGELLLWRDGDNHWHARLIRDADNDETSKWQEAIDEFHILWGTHAQPLCHGFTLMIDGIQGLCHAVPIELVGEFSKENRPLRLCVRHYIEEDEDGFARIVASRLVDLKKE
jgi:CRISPR-associated protein (TIGR03984 family)